MLCHFMQFSVILIVMRSPRIANGAMTGFYSNIDRFMRGGFYIYCNVNINQHIVESVRDGIFIHTGIDSYATIDTIQIHCCGRKITGIHRVC